jgi:hypothetical protein
MWILSEGEEESKEPDIERTGWKLFSTGTSVKMDESGLLRPQSSRRCSVPIEALSGLPSVEVWRW